MKIIFGEPYLVYWTDPHGYDGWQDLSSAKYDGPSECQTFGKILNINADKRLGDAILICPTTAPDSRGEVLSPLVIPIKDILSIQKVKVFGKVWKQGDELYGD